MDVGRRHEAQLLRKLHQTYSRLQTSPHHYQNHSKPTLENHYQYTSSPDFDHTHQQPYFDQNLSHFFHHQPYQQDTQNPNQIYQPLQNHLNPQIDIHKDSQLLPSTNSTALKPTTPAVDAQEMFDKNPQTMASDNIRAIQSSELIVMAEGLYSDEIEQVHDSINDLISFEERTEASLIELRQSTESGLSELRAQLLELCVNEEKITEKIIENQNNQFMELKKMMTLNRGEISSFISDGSHLGFTASVSDQTEDSKSKNGNGVFQNQFALNNQTIVLHQQISSSIQEKSFPCDIEQSEAMEVQTGAMTISNVPSDQCHTNSDAVADFDLSLGSSSPTITATIVTSQNQFEGGLMSSVSTNSKNWNTYGAPKGLFWADHLAIQVIHR